MRALLAHWRNPLGFLVSISREFGDVVYFQVGRERVFFLVHPDAIKVVLVTEQDGFQKGLTYEWSKRSTLAQPPAKDLETPAPHGELEGLIGQLDNELTDKGYFHPPSRTQATRNTIRTIFTKTGWSSREVKAVRGIIRALVGPPRRG